MRQLLAVAAALALALPAASIAADTKPPIVVVSPARNASVARTIHVFGTSDVFEATMALEVSWHGHKIQHRVVTATSGSGTRGTWSVVLRHLPQGNVTLRLFEPSAKDGSPLHIVLVPLHVR